MDYANGLARWGGSAGSPVELFIGGQWRSIGAPKNAEAAGYIKRALADPEVSQLLTQAQQPGFTPTGEQQFTLRDIDGLLAVGQEFRGGDYGGVNLFEPGLSGSQANRMKRAGGAELLTPDQTQQAKQFWNAHEPKTDDDFGLMELAMLAAAQPVPVLLAARYRAALSMSSA